MRGRWRGRGSGNARLQRIGGQPVCRSSELNGRWVGEAIEADTDGMRGSSGDIGVKGYG